MIYCVEDDDNMKLSEPGRWLTRAKGTEIK